MGAIDLAGPFLAVATVFLGLVTMIFHLCGVKEFETENNAMKAWAALLKRMFVRRRQSAAAKFRRRAVIFTSGVHDALLREGLRSAPKAAWAVHGHSNDKVLGFVNPIHWTVQSREHAEIIALWEGIQYALDRFQLAKGDHLVAWTQCEHAADVLSGRKQLRVARTGEMLVLAQVRAVIRQSGVVVDVRCIHDEAAVPASRQKMARTVKRALLALGQHTVNTLPKV